MTRLRGTGCCSGGFNEAAGIHRRKLRVDQRGGDVVVHRFNEAAGIHRRKPRATGTTCADSNRASMRPPEFTGGNLVHQLDLAVAGYASMRPPEFTGGNKLARLYVSRESILASMRPPEFTGGNSTTGGDAQDTQMLQ